MKRVALFLLFFLFIPIVVKAQAGIGVEPSKIEIDFLKNERYVIPLKIWNAGNIDGTYSIVLTDEIEKFVKCEEGYWCGESYTVKAHTTRLDNYTLVPILLIKSDSENIDTGFFVKLNSIEGGGTVAILPQIFVKTKIIQSYAEEEPPPEGEEPPPERETPPPPEKEETPLKKKTKKKPGPKTKPPPKIDYSKMSPKDIFDYEPQEETPEYAEWVSAIADLKPTMQKELSEYADGIKDDFKKKLDILQDTNKNIADAYKKYILKEK